MRRLRCSHDVAHGRQRSLNGPAGRGRGRQVIAVARTADMIVMMLDATKGDTQRYSARHSLRLPRDTATPLTLAGTTHVPCPPTQAAA